MTEKNAKKRLEVWLKCMDCPEDKQCYDSHLHSTCEYTDYCDETPISEAVKVAIKALQEPCEDCISREWIKTAIHNFYYGLMHTPTEEDIQAYLDVAPSVQPKTGYWIDMDEGFSPCECSNCGKIEFIKSKYCPNCGAKMESEG